jgi:predicted Zn-dependent peptidase
MEESRAVSSFLGAQELIRNKIESVDEVIARIESVTMEDIERAAQRVINANKLVLALVGPFEDAGRFQTMLEFK